MIIVEVGRGLGNSMYVYAAGRSLAEHYKTDFRIDTSYLDAWPRPNYKYGGSWDVVIEKFNISAKRANRKEYGRFLFRTGIRYIDRFLYKFKLLEKNVVRFPTSGKIEDFYKIPKDTYLIIYGGEDKFFKKIKKIIQKEFTLKEKFKKNISEDLKRISMENSVSIHVRHGDVLEIKNANVIGLEFYKPAIEMINKKVKNPVFYVFSDDIDWCKKNFKKLGVKIKFMEGNKDYEDLELMKACKHNIITNSALSWWAGYLNTNTQKMVIAPKNFTHFKGAKSTILPREWIRI
ncbi:MAG: alpha-1,2-fucosyltransferase [Nanoarchaeota archaeon]|nr:alpha-1,2-fucosyltransferase [Nanoarchaeota archaeon]